MMLQTTLLSFLVLIASDSEWQIYTRADDMNIHYRYTSEDILEIQAEKELVSCASAFLHLLEDTDRIQDWVSNTERATILERPNVNTHIVHTEFRGIWPVMRRDMVTRSTWIWDEKLSLLTLNIEDASEELAPTERTVRMTDVQAVWQLQQLAEQELTIVYRGQANPAGNIPRGIARNTALRAIHRTFRALDEILLEYQVSYEGIPCQTYE